MSEFSYFYTEIDPNLRKELDARGRTGRFNRSTDSLEYMLGKIANVQVEAFEGSSSLGTPIAILGGSTTRTGRYQPSGPDGFLSNPTYTKPIVEYYKDDEKFAIDQANAISNQQRAPQLGYAYDSQKSYQDDSRRIGPVLTGVDVSVGDHSMALLNKATIKFIVPNIDRDLDFVESVWFRPGRFCKIIIVHPETAIVSRKDTEGLLTEDTIPQKDKLKKLYGEDWPIDDYLNEVRKMNQFIFEGLITSFDFSLTEDGSIDATLSLSGRSAVFADVTLLTKTPEAESKAEARPKVEIDPILQVPVIQIEAPAPNTVVGPSPEPSAPNVPFNILEAARELEDLKSQQARKGFYERLYNQFENSITQLAASNPEIQPDISTLLINSSTNKEQTDSWILRGSPYSTSQTTNNEDILINNAPLERYVTLSYLIDYVNKIVKEKLGDDKAVVIKCSDALTFSNYHANLVSAVPEDVLLLPQTYSSPGDMNSYGNLSFYGNIDQVLKGTWPGVYQITPTSKTIYSSRIFINLKFVEKVVKGLSDNYGKDFRLKSFVTNILSRIAFATGGAINLNMISHPSDINQLIIADTKFIQPSPTNTENKKVNAYSVPMFANHTAGSIVHSFNMNAKLPTSAKNLAFVMNTSTDISESELAPYLNFMYSSGTGKAEQINNLLIQYEGKYNQAIANLNAARVKYGQNPGQIKDVVETLSNALIEYMKYPTKDIKTSQQMIAPMFPFEVDFTIDGINGLRFGDVLTFDALPSRYRYNTVFSVGSITHSVDTSGRWITTVKCFMRAQI